MSQINGTASAFLKQIKECFGTFFLRYLQPWHHSRVSSGKKKEQATRNKIKTFNLSYKSKKVNKAQTWQRIKFKTHRRARFFLPSLFWNVSVPQHDSAVLKLDNKAEASTSMGSQLSLSAAEDDRHTVQATIWRARRQGKAPTCRLRLTTAAGKGSFKTRYVKQQASSMHVSVAWFLSSNGGTCLQ